MNQPGELYVSGVGVSLGYINQPQKTQKVFIPNCIQDGYKTLYKTGDLVKWDEHGYLHYICRTDDQVKIRGIRIELGEIEAAIKSFPDVDYNVVVPYKEEGSNTLLICFYISHRNVTPKAYKKTSG